MNVLNAKKIPFEEIDLSDPKNAKTKENLVNELKKKSLSLLTPLIYLGDEYLGVIYSRYNYY